MIHARSPLLSLTLSLLPAALPAFGAAPAPAKPAPAARPVIAVADFSGADRQVGRFLADSLQTGLGRSPRLRLLECAEVRSAIGALKLTGDGMTDSHQVRLLGQRVSARRLLVGSYLAQDDQIIINVRLLDVASGRPVPGAAESVTGP